MKLGTVRIAGKPVLIAAVGADQAVTLADACTAAGTGPAPADMNALIEGGADTLARIAAAVRDAPARGVALHDTTALDWLPPQPRPTKVLGVAFNNMGIRKSAHVDPGVPNFFLKAPSCLTGHRKPIVIRQNYGETIPEPELAVVIGQRCSRIAASDAMAVVFGYTIVNDITSHGLKFGVDSIATTREEDLLRPHHLAWRRQHGPDDRDVYFVYHTRSKASDTFGPMGPWLTTADEIADPDALGVTAWIDGAPFAVDNTASYRFKVAQVIAEASAYFTLEPGDVICMGTSARGVGEYPNGHRDVNLHARDGTMEIEIDGLGRLANPIHRDWLVE
jgi:2-keto-4-pentenoate hydratase/2-oxohepta-3-ene-1,7-dioic acid hydratase in catechol pathway